MSGDEAGASAGLRVEVRRDACVGSGQCVLTAPEVFDQDEDDALVEVLDAHPPAAVAPAVRHAAAGCPARAITLLGDAPD